MERIATRPTLGRRYGTPLGLEDWLDDRVHAFEVSSSDPDGPHAPWVMRHLRTAANEVRR
jgi:hypothetical protein